MAAFTNLSIFYKEKRTRVFVRQSHKVTQKRFSKKNYAFRTRNMWPKIVFGAHKI